MRVRDNSGVETVVRTLREGDHFGEISCYYGFKRTATVTSMNYNTFAKMTKEWFTNVVSDYPEYEECLKEHILQNYKDDLIKFKLSMLQKIDYLSTAPDHILYEIIFSMQHLSFEKDSVIFGAGGQSVADSIVFIESGTVIV